MKGRTERRGGNWEDHLAALRSAEREDAGATQRIANLSDGHDERHVGSAGKWTIVRPNQRTSGCARSSASTRARLAFDSRR
jgi:hypothetical protein